MEYLIENKQLIPVLLEMKKYSEMSIRFHFTEINIGSIY